MPDSSQSSNNDDLRPAAPLTPPSSGDVKSRLSFFTTPLSLRGWPTWLVYMAAVVGVIYVLNPTLGVFEFIPDNIPLIGNLDEGAAYLLAWFGLVEYLNRKTPPPDAP
jgi:hypothetical protein